MLYRVTVRKWQPYVADIEVEASDVFKAQAAAANDAETRPDDWDWNKEDLAPDIQVIAVANKL